MLNDSFKFQSIDMKKLERRFKTNAELRTAFKVHYEPWIDFTNLAWEVSPKYEAFKNGKEKLLMTTERSNII
jgi:hypothetical protein